MYSTIYIFVYFNNNHIEYLEPWVNFLIFCIPDIIGFYVFTYKLSDFYPDFFLFISRVNASPRY